MATVDDLIPLIYHERQEPGSMLCAQHALNALLQGHYLTAPDLSAIAVTLDEEEAQYDEANHGHTSTNMDDTGFFSVQVLERALQVWGLTLVRWRSERMRPFQEHPHTQLAFILNLQQHWYTLRRFGAVSPDPFSEAGSGIGHWFNLNSSLEAPEWVSKLYLGMVLQQAEAEGYSVFAVVQEDPELPLSLPRSPADPLAATIPNLPSHSGSRPSATRSISQPASRKQESSYGFEDEDMELQAALQASLMAGGAYDYQPASTYIPPPASSSSGPGVLTPTQRHSRAANAAQVEEEDDSAEAPETFDPVAASMARSHAYMQRMQREQEAALRESYQGEMARVESATARRGTAYAQEDDEDEMFRRAMAESEAMARNAQAAAPALEEEEDDEIDIDYHPPEELSRLNLPQSVSAYPHRVYDDEDAELQAALKASLESVPEGFVIPDSPPQRAGPSLPAASAAVSAPTPVPAPAPIQRQPSTASESGFETETESETEQPQVEQLSMEEIRRRRLARFGG